MFYHLGQGTFSFFWPMGPWNVGRATLENGECSSFGAMGPSVGPWDLGKFGMFRLLGHGTVLANSECSSFWPMGPWTMVNVLALGCLGYLERQGVRW